MASRPKNFSAQPSTKVETAPAESDASHPVVHLGETLITQDTIDLTDWLEMGIDQWVWATTGQLQAFHVGKTHTQASIVAYGMQGMPTFFEFLLSIRRRPPPDQLVPDYIQQFIDWLKKQTEWSLKTKRNRYGFVKTVLLGMRRRGLVSIDSTAFPKNQFPDNGHGEPGERSLSLIERAALAGAIKSDLISIHKNTYTGTAADMLAVYVLALAFRTGLNLTPMLEMTRDAISPHPFIPNMRLLRTFKRRANKTSFKAINATRTDAEPTSIPMDGVALFEQLLKKTEHLIAEAAPQDKNGPWLHRTDSSDPGGPGKVRRLNSRRLSKGISRLVTFHQLIGDDGLPLRLNLSRLRKTTENRLWVLSNGDLFTVSLIMEHEQRVAEHSYLQVTPEMRQNATIVGEALPDMFRDDGKAKGKRKTIPIKPANTPLANCKDSLYGDKAPKDGTNHCIDFLSCLGCRSFAVVGSPEDLHRLFSFYWFQFSEIDQATSQELREYYTRITVQIDDFTLKNFSKDTVVDAKERARVAPHKFWTLPGLAANSPAAKQGK